jgi:hypothetical protein
MTSQSLNFSTLDFVDIIGVATKSVSLRSQGSLLVLLGGCGATATKPEAMAVDAHETQRYETILGSIYVIVEGGNETSSAGTSQISNSDFRSAIVDSIKATTLFETTADDSSEASYVLHASIIDVEQPSFGFSMTVTIEVAWSLGNKSEDRPIWRSSHVSTYTASAGEAFAGVTRLRLATEGAAKQNITWALKTISEDDNVGVD